MGPLQRGIELFNEGSFFECHEVLEEEWTPLRGPRRVFLQALIHVAVGMHHWQRGNARGASGQFQKGLRKLEPYRPFCEGIHTGRLYRDVEGALKKVEAAGGFECFQILVGEAIEPTICPPTT